MLGPCQYFVDPSSDIARYQSLFPEGALMADNPDKLDLILHRLDIIRETLKSHETRLREVESGQGVAAQVEKKPLPLVDAPTYRSPLAASAAAEAARLIPDDVDKPLEQPEEPLEEEPTFPTMTAPTRPARHSEDDNKSPGLESLIGEDWLAKIGVVGLLIGVAFFLRYAVDQDWIGIGTQVALIYLLGLAATATTHFIARFKSDYRKWIAVLRAGGVATLYLTTFAATHQYDLLGPFASLTILSLISLYVGWIGVSENEKRLTGFAIVFAFLAPFFVGDGQSQTWPLMLYLGVINLMAGGVLLYKRWNDLALLVMIPTYLLCLLLGWENKYTLLLSLGLFHGLYFAFEQLLFREKFPKTEAKQQLFLFQGINGLLYFLSIVSLLLSGWEPAQPALYIALFIPAVLGYVSGALRQLPEMAWLSTGFVYLGLTLYFGETTTTYFFFLMGSFIFFLLATILFFPHRIQQVESDDPLQKLLGINVGAYLFFPGFLLLVGSSTVPPWPVLSLLALPNLVLALSAMRLNLGWPNYLTRILSFLLLFLVSGENAPHYLYSLLALFGLYHLLDIRNLWLRQGNHRFAGSSVLVLINHVFVALGLLQTLGQNSLPAVGILLTIIAGLNLSLLLLDFRLRWLQAEQRTGLVVVVIFHLLLAPFMLFGQLEIRNLLYALWFALSALTLQITGMRQGAKSLLRLGDLILLVSFLLLSILRTDSVLPALFGSVGSFRGLENPFLNAGFLIDIILASTMVARYQLGNKFAALSPFLWSQILIYAPLSLFFATLSAQLIGFLHSVEADRGTLHHALSALWLGLGTLSILLGILWRQVPLRLFGLVVYGLALLKILLADITYLDTLQKTFVFLLLGVLLITSSFAYRRFRNQLADFVREQEWENNAEG